MCLYPMTHLSSSELLVQFAELESGICTGGVMRIKQKINKCQALEQYRVQRPGSVMRLLNISVLT